MKSVTQITVLILTLFLSSSIRIPVCMAQEDALEIVYERDNIFEATFEEEGINYYVLCDENGKYLHTPVPYIIEWELTQRELFEDMGWTLPDDFVDPDWERFWYSDPELNKYVTGIYIPSTGAFTGFRFYEFFRFSDSIGLAPVSDPVSGLFGYIDKNGELVIPFQWSWADPFDDKTGTACVSYISRNGYNNAYIDAEGVIIRLGPPYSKD